MSNTPAISNRLHRSGAIDFNVEFAVREANVNSSVPAGGKKRVIAADALGPGKDALSVCEGEPLYTTKYARGNRYSSVDSCRNPISCLSSVNGMSIDVSAISDLLQCILRAKGDNDEVLKLAALEEVRNKFFDNIVYTGIAVSKWAFDRQGHQQDQFVATLGGVNTFYVDETVRAGDTLVVDIPPLEDAGSGDKMLQAMIDDINAFGKNKPWGFVPCQVKKGTPKNKKTLVIRRLPMPRLQDTQPGSEKMLGAIKAMQDDFSRRRQIIGVCVTGAKAGERCDAVLNCNAIGTLAYRAGTHADVSAHADGEHEERKD